MTAAVSRMATLAHAQVLQYAGEYRLVSTQPVEVHTHLFDIEGELKATPSRYSVQIGHTSHVDLPRDQGPDDAMDRFYWCFMNHSCEPSAVIRGRRVFSRVPLQAGQEITFHYNTTEYDLAEPFTCWCASSRCEGRISGFRWLSPTRRERLRPWLAAHLLSYLDATVSEAAVGVET